MTDQNVASTSEEKNIPEVCPIVLVYVRLAHPLDGYVVTGDDFCTPTEKSSRPGDEFEEKY